MISRAFLVVVVLYQISRVHNLYEGDFCTNTNVHGNFQGSCTHIRKCPWADNQIRQHLHVDFCNYINRVPIVCCPEEKYSDDPVIFPRSDLYPDKTTSTGSISSAKCDEFYPTKTQFVYGGTPSLAHEFPHMAALGYGSEHDTQWRCGGSLISLRHIITAAHCLQSHEFGDVKFVRLGDLDINSNSDTAEPQDFTVAKSIPHPKYEPATSKHDIAIIKLNKKIVWTQFVQPACLHVGNPWPHSWPVTATGWGITEFGGLPSSHLIKVALKILDNTKCRQQYAKTGLKGNIDDKSQVCAQSSDPTKIMDTCKGDSGGPLQVTNFTREKHYTIIGVTSFGKACGLSNSGGIYTRVSYYVPWIESIVWNSKT